GRSRDRLLELAHRMAAERSRVARAAARRARGLAVWHRRRVDCRPDGTAAGGLMGAALLSLQAVSKSYWRGPSEVRVLCDASLEVQAGEFIGVWGRRGAGKTTLLRIAAGLETPDRGTVRFDDTDLAAL